MSNPSTEPQLRYIHGLLKEAGVHQFKLNRDHEVLPHIDLGYDTVAEWVQSLSTVQASEVIKYLKDANGHG